MIHGETKISPHIASRREAVIVRRPWCAVGGGAATNVSAISFEPLLSTLSSAPSAL